MKFDSASESDASAHKDACGNIYSAASACRTILNRFLNGFGIKRFSVAYRAVILDVDNHFAPPY